MNDEEMSEAPAITAPVDDLLSRFPGPVTLYPPRETWSVLPAVSLMLVIILGFLILAGVAHTVWGWIAVLLLSVYLIISAMRLLPGAASLTLDAGGLEERMLVFRRDRAQWRDITHITADAAPGARSGTTFVWYNDTQWKRDWPAQQETEMPGCNARLADTYGLSAEELAELMMRWQQKALAADRNSRSRIDLLI